MVTASGYWLPCDDSFGTGLSVSGVGRVQSPKLPSSELWGAQTSSQGNEKRLKDKIGSYLIAIIGYMGAYTTEGKTGLRTMQSEYFAETNS